MNKELTTDQMTRELRKCEAIILDAGEGMRSAFRRIREEKLYRAACRTWEEYCTAFVHAPKRSIDRIIEAERLFENVADLLQEQNGTKFVPKLAASALREVSDLPPEQQREIVKGVVDSGEKPTTKAVEKARDQVAPKPPNPVKPPQAVAWKQKQSKALDSAKRLMREVDSLNEAAPNEEAWRAALGDCEKVVRKLEAWK